jgi:hypothetical protein
MCLFSRIVGNGATDAAFGGCFVSILADYCMAVQSFGSFGYTQKLFYFNNRSATAILGHDNNLKLVATTHKGLRNQALTPHPSIVTFSRDSTSNTVWSTQAINSFTPCSKVCSILTWSRKHRDQGAKYI